jgi:hypothetical protein
VSRRSESLRARRDGLAERVDIRPDVDGGAALPADDQPAHLAVLPGIRLRPVHAHERRLLRGGFEPDPVSGGALPRVERPPCELPIGRAVAGARVAGGDEVRNRARDVERPRRRLLQPRPGNRKRRQHRERERVQPHTAAS